MPDQGAGHRQRFQHFSHGATHAVGGEAEEMVTVCDVTFVDDALDLETRDLGRSSPGWVHHICEVEGRLSSMARSGGAPRVSTELSRQVPSTPFRT